MVWADMKRFVRSKFCKNLAEINRAINEYRESLTQAKCQRFINHLNRVIVLFKFERDCYAFFYPNFFLLKVIEEVIRRDGGWSNM